jgi:hypothetical protein
MSNPTIEEVQALDGKIFAMLNAREAEVLEYFRARGRKYGVAVTISESGDFDELAAAKSKDQANQIMKRTNSRVMVVVSADAIRHQKI